MLTPASPSPVSDPTPQTIRLRGVRQHNLRGFDLDIPLGQLTVVTGPSGSGKSSLAFDTLYAEGQRRYVETFSPFVRQFFERMEAPEVDTIEGIPPAIAIEQVNRVRTTRSTVGTITEVNDYLKLLFARLAVAIDPVDGSVIRPSSAASIADKLLQTKPTNQTATANSGTEKAPASATTVAALVLFPLKVPPDINAATFAELLQSQGFLRVWIDGTTYRSDQPEGWPALPAEELWVVQDRLKLAEASRPRLLEALEAGLEHGRGRVAVTSSPGKTGVSPTDGGILPPSRRGADTPSYDDAPARPERQFSSHWHNPATGTTLHPPTPGLFSFNHPLGACPECRGFGKVLGLNLDLVVPDPALSIRKGAIAPFRGNTYGESRRDLLRAARTREVDVDLPWQDLPEADRRWVIEGERGDPEELYNNGLWYGIRGFFNWLETRTYKMHVRVFLSRYRSQTTCPACAGTRLQPEALCFRLLDRTLADLQQLTAAELLELLGRVGVSPTFEGVPPEKHGTRSGSEGSRRDAASGRQDASLSLDAPTAQVLQEVLSRLGYLNRVGLGYLTLDRETRTLSGGEVARVNLCTCLGASLSQTLFILDEPSIGLHARDNQRLIGILRELVERGNTLVVVEHDEAFIRAADHVVDIGPGSGPEGGQLLHSGRCKDFLEQAPAESPTRAWLAGETPLPARPERRRAGDFLQLRGISCHNLRDVDLDLPLGILCGISGVSGSGKSTLLEQVLAPALEKRFGTPGGALPKQRRRRDEPVSTPQVASLSGLNPLDGYLVVDQSPLARTSRSAPALYLGIWDEVRQLFARTEAAEERGWGISHFSFNAGNGRCPRCQGAGWEKVEMQFLSDITVRCPECEGRRFRPSTLEVTWHDQSVADLLDLPASDARRFFKEVRHGLAPGRNAVPAASDGVPPPSKSTNDPESRRDPASGPQDAAPPLSPQETKHVEKILTALEALEEVGLGYLALGQPLTQLSGGEAQRLKLVRHLLDGQAARHKKRWLLLLDEPTTGLHQKDVLLLARLLQRLVDEGHSLLLIEHHLELLAQCDWLVDLGPEAGAAGGHVVAEGTPEDVVGVEESRTGHWLRQVTGDRSQVTGKLPRAAEDVGTYSATDAKRREPNLSPATCSPSPADRGAIRIHNARHHNLKNLDLTIPRNQFVVVTGLSGSGKSTLAFDVVFAEGQRRFLDSMSPYARQFAEQLEKPEIDSITGLPPTVAIEQRISQGGGKSTIGTVTEIHQFLRLLWARLGTQYCPDCQVPVEPQPPEAIVEALWLEQGSRGAWVALQAPLIRGRKGFHTEVAEGAARKGIELLWVDGEEKPTQGFEPLERYVAHDIDAVVLDRSGKIEMPQLEQAVTRALALGKGTLIARYADGSTRVFSTARACPSCQRSFAELDPRQFSYNSPHGWCPHCRGFGVERAARDIERARHHADNELAAELHAEQQLEGGDADALRPCHVCDGSRLNETAKAVRLGKWTLPDLSGMGVEQLAGIVDELTAEVTGHKSQATGDLPDSSSEATSPESDPSSVYGELSPRHAVAAAILPEISQRLGFLSQVGLGYLALGRSARTLSGGEAQRIRLAAQLGGNLRGVLYVLDEPTIGLHPRDNARLLDALQALQQQGNSLLVVEHDDETMARADHILDLGPGAGRLGGEIVANGNFKQIKASTQSATARCLAEPMIHPLRGQRRSIPGTNSSSGWVRLYGASRHNLKNVNLRLPVGRLTVVTGVSGSGKSTLVRGVLTRAAEQALGGMSSNRKKTVDEVRGADFKRARGFGQLSALYQVDQSPIGKTSRSCPATFVKVFDDIRKLFASTPEARLRGWDAGRFSFNTEGGRCPDCNGIGRIKLEMAFLPPSWVTCESCCGRRYEPITDQVRWNDRSIGDVLQLTIAEAAEFFEAQPRIATTLQLLADCGLGYLQLGQPSPTLSGGEAQRIKLVAELTKGVHRTRQARLRENRGAGSHLYVIEEPTIGLHLADVALLIDVLHRLVDEGHTVVVIEHHLDLIAEADYVVDLGPEAGEAGGEILVQDTPEKVVACPASHTGGELARLLR